MALATMCALAAWVVLAPLGPAPRPLDGRAAVFAARPFDSPIRPKPSHTPQPTHTPKPTATSELGAFISPLGTPLPSPTATRTPTPTPTLPRRAWLPLLAQPLRYGWKGVADPGELSNANKTNGFWGLNPDWYYNWGFAGPWAAAHEGQAQSAAEIAALLDAALDDPAYVPMIWCTDDVNYPGRRYYISPQTAADTARNRPGRVWLVFNEPDIVNDSDNCGTMINDHYTTEVTPPIDYYSGFDYGALGAYLAKQYIRYYDAIKAADPTARLFPFGGALLTSASGGYGVRETSLWNGFTSYLANPTTEPNRTPRPLDGIALHAYPNHSATCGVFDAACLQQKLISAHNFYQGLATPTPPALTNANPTFTAGKPIWITEIGNLAAGGNPPGSPQIRPTTQANTANQLTQPLLTWHTANAIPGGSVPYFNAIAWFSTHDCRYNKNGSIKDFTASDLLDIGPLACPITTQPTTPQRTAIGELWAATTCVQCACPGPDCP